MVHMETHRALVTHGPDDLGSDPALGTCALHDLELVAPPPCFLPNREDRDEVSLM